MRFVRTEKAFWDYVDGFLVKYDKRYELTEGNSFLKAVYEKGSDGKSDVGVFYRKKLSDDEMKNLWIFSATKKQVKAWLNSNRLEILPEMYPSVKKNLSVYDNLPTYGKFLSTDMNHCYWRMAYNLGYIKLKLYERLIDEDLPEEKQKEYKLLRNKALACLRTLETVHDLQGLQRIRSYSNGSGEMEQLYNDLRNRCYKIIHDIADAIGEGFIKYRTDCIYYLPQHKDTVEAMLQQSDMPHRTYECKKIDDKYFCENYDAVKKL